MSRLRFSLFSSSEDPNTDFEKRDFFLSCKYIYFTIIFFFFNVCQYIFCQKRVCLGCMYIYYDSII